MQSNFHSGPSRKTSPAVGSTTPWGRASHTRTLLPGITKVDTSSHGGIHLTPHRLNQLPLAARMQDGWYEEDLEAVIVLYFFHDRILEASGISAPLAECRAIIRQYFPRIL